MSIQKLILPKSVTSVGDFAFPIDQSVQVYVEYENPNGLGSNYPFFIGCNTRCIYIPDI